MNRSHYAVATVALVTLVILANAGGAAAMNVKIEANTQTVGMGRCVEITAVILDDRGRPTVDCQVLPYVNHKRWGAHEATDADGRAVFHLPLPNAGPQNIQIVARPVRSQFGEHWIWLGTPIDNQTVYVMKAFDLAKSPERAALSVTGDDSCRVWLNGHRLGESDSWQEPLTIADVAPHLRSGRNVLAIEATNGDGPGGIVAHLEIAGMHDDTVVDTDATWRAWSDAPADWPEPATDNGGVPATVAGRVDAPPWGPGLKHWPGLDPANARDRIAGTPMRDDEAGIVSNALRIDVTPRKLSVPAADKERTSFFGAQWEPWFTPHNAFWQTAQAVPLMGFYESWNPDVCRQQAIWMIEAGVDFIIPDWSNHMWDKKHWNERTHQAHEINHATTMMLEQMAVLRDEGQPTLKTAFFIGLINGPPTTKQALDEGMAWIHRNYISNTRFAGLFQEHEGRPLVLILDTVNYSGQQGIVFDDERFTIRMMSAQNDITQHDKLGFWSWMDGVDDPIVTYKDGAPEAVTVSVGYFSTGGWLRPTARGHQGGATYIDTFKTALRERPSFIQLHQWQEFAGQPEGHGHGPDKDIYVDSYSVELSDDIEPVSLTAHAYRGEGGWGFRYLNLTRALIDLYRGEAPGETILAVAAPIARQVVTSDMLTVRWTWVGEEPGPVRIELNGRTVAEGLVGADGVMGGETAVDVSALGAGDHTLTVTAPSARTRYPLSETRVDEPLSEPIAPKVVVHFRR